MLKDISIGQYIPGNSFLHSSDPRSKLVCMFVYIILIFCTFNYYSLIIMLAVTIVCVLVSRVKIRTYAKSLKFVIYIIIFTAVINIFYGSGNPVFKLGFVKITEQGINNSVFVSLRLISLVFISSVLTFTTTPMQLTDALERLLRPLKIFKINISALSMMMTIALRFVPTLLEETEKIIDAQKSRGADFESGNIAKKIKSLVPILIPLFVSSFKRASDLAIAMECRCYNVNKERTKMKILKFSGYDFIMILFTIIFSSGVILCNVIFPQTLR